MSAVALLSLVTDDDMWDVRLFQRFDFFGREPHVQGTDGFLQMRQFGGPDDRRRDRRFLKQPCQGNTGA